LISPWRFVGLALHFFEEGPNLLVTEALVFVDNLFGWGWGLKREFGWRVWIFEE
jgi:hypothetical protein